jgi:ferredoxin-NADP reductase
MMRACPDGDLVPGERASDMDQDAMGGYGFYPLTVRQVIDETSDARSFVLAIPDDLRGRFRYRAGQFCSFRVRVGGESLVRCYSMASSPDTDDEFKVTVKRVPGGSVSNWMIDNLGEGNVLDVTPPAGRFCLKNDEARRVRPLVAFSGGSGITPVISLIKTLLSTTERRASLLYANRDRHSIIFLDELEALSRSNQRRLRILHRLDVEHGFVDQSGVVRFVGDERDADFYICGPAPFMDVVEEGLRGLGIAKDRIFIERFSLPADEAVAAETSSSSAPDADVQDDVRTETVTIVLQGKEHTFAYHPGETILETARRGGLKAPYSCESGNCGTCLARVKVGAGLVLTCQGVPITKTITVEYED